MTISGHISRVMPSIINRMRGKIAGDDKPARKPDETVTVDVEPEGLDARRLAEWKADEAGRKWRAAAEARGEIARETGGPQGLEPTRYGDWERAGRCVDF